MCRWHLGKRLLAPLNIFYKQAAATVHFLYHGEKGSDRERLLDHVTSHYTGSKEKLSIEAAFGLAPAQLGEKVTAYAQRVAEGWCPDGP